MRYLTKPLAAVVERWELFDQPPAGVHDTFQIPGELPAGYLSTHEGDKIVHLGDYVATFIEDGRRIRLSEEELRENFVKDE